MKNLVDLLNSVRESDKGITFLKINGEESFYSYRLLYKSALNRLQQFRNQGISVGDEIVFQISSDIIFIESLWASIIGGLTVIPLTLADSSSSEQKLKNILDLLEHPKLISDSDTIIQNYNALDLKGTVKESSHLRPISAINPLLIQFSSGSTGLPKGVIVSHENLIANLDSMRSSLQFREEEIFLSWAPLTHSSGMILAHFNAVRGNYNQVQMNRDVFISNPLEWMVAASKHKATFIFSPNFGYKYLLSAMNEDVDYDWDLSSVRYIMNGSEQIAADTALEFISKLKKYRLNSNAMTTIYGLAEATLAVSCDSVAKDLEYLDIERSSINPGKGVIIKEYSDADTIKVVSQGKAVANSEIRIHHGANLDEGYVGEIQVKSDSVVSSYYKNPEASDALLTEDGWLKTGDLGFLSESKLFVCGRQKELIIINGINYYPNDIESQISQISKIPHNHIIISSKINTKTDAEEIVCGIASTETVNFDNLRKKFLLNYGINIAHFKQLQHIPTTSNGKKQRIQFGSDFEMIEKRAEDINNIRKLDKWEIKDCIVRIAKTFTDGTFDTAKNFAFQGFNSIKTVEFVAELSRELNIILDAFEIFNNPNADLLSDFINNKISNPPNQKTDIDSIDYTDVAIIGIDCRFPFASNADEFYDNLITHKDCITEIPKSRWKVAEIKSDKIQDIPNFGGFLSDIDLFDNEFFNILPIEAKSLDPQQRLLLETTIHALEDANIKIDDIKGTNCGVYLGIANSDYATVEAKSNDLKNITPYSFTGFTPSTAAGRISYFLDLHGPNLAIDTACSSSLAALHYAARDIANQECGVAIVSGVNLILSPEMNVGLHEMGVLAEDGRCKTFDYKANGYVRSEGCATLIVKSLKRAEADADKIYGVIKGSALSHDGASNGLTAPNGKAQINVMQKSLDIANMQAEDICYFEAHGTGTVVGDLQELNSIQIVCGTVKPYHRVGSVKSNIGHTEATAGLAGVVKLLKSYENGTLPANLHFSKLPVNADLEFTNSNVLSKNTDLDVLLKHSPNSIFRASINSFGYSGTNVNLILEKYKQQEALPKVIHTSNALRVLPLSAITEASLDEMIFAYSNLLQTESVHIDDLIANIEDKRTGYNFRAGIVSNNAQLAEKAKNPKLSQNKVNILRSSRKVESKGIVFTYPGGGAQRLKMGQELMLKEPVFAKAMQECDTLLKKHIHTSIIDIIDSDYEKLGKLEYAQPALFAIEYSLSQMFISFGITPSALIGHSTGEYAAACIAGIISLTDATKMIAIRANLMDNIATKGKMVAVYTNAKAVERYIDNYRDFVSIATINSTENTVISGVSEYVDVIIKAFESDNIEYKELKISQASHSPVMVEIIEEYYDVIKDIEFKESKIDYYDNIEGKKLEKGRILDATYWCDHILKCVNFAKTMRSVRRDAYHVFLELGPSPVLTGVGLQDYPYDLFISAFEKDFTEHEQIQRVLASLYVNGANIKFSSIYNIKEYNNISLPKYKFSKKRFWQDPNLGLYREQSKVIQATSPIPELDTMIEAKNYKNELLDIVSEKTGLEIEQIDIDYSFFRLGMDSLTLVKLRQEIDKRYSLSISMSDLIKTYNNIAKLAEYIDNNLIKEEINKTEKLQYEKPSAVQTQNMPTNEVVLNSNGNVESIINQQMQIMQQQLNLLQQSMHVNNDQVSPAKTVKIKAKPVNFRSLKLDSDGLSYQQEQFVSKLIERYNQKTRRSMEYAQQYRKSLCDWINTLSFRYSLKKMSYPFVSAKSQGAYVWDLDGNKYIDLANGYGVHFFGHRPKFIEEAILRQIEKGFELGPQSAMVGETAELLARLSNNERVTFCNTGSEAIMVAIRVARAKTGRDEIIIFGGSYHGTFDGVLAVPDDAGNSHPVSIGVPEGMIENVKVLDYGSEEALRYIREHGTNIAAVICEPVQSRKPHLQPKEFLKKLRSITTESSTTLIFDEVVNGFRISAGGAQEFYGIKADLVTYGKVIGGGMPLGVLAGKAEFLDYIDGGEWNFEDKSRPENDIIFFGGTFCKHPLTIAACNAVLKKIEAEGESMYLRLNTLTESFVKRANSLFAELRVPLTCSHFSSQFRIDGLNEYSLLLKPIELDIFFYLMIYKGVYFWERKVNFFSTETSEEDVDSILIAMKEALLEMIENGFFPDASRILSPVKIQEASTGQRRMYLLSQYEGGEIAYHITLPFTVKGDLNYKKLEEAFNKIIARHEILRTSYYLKDSNIVGEVDDKYDFSLTHFKIEKDIQSSIHNFIQPFDLSQLPLFRVGLVNIDKGTNLMVLDAHHIIFDGISIAVLVDELCKFYRGVELEYQPTQFNKFLFSEKMYFNSSHFHTDRDYWLKNLANLPSAPELPYDYSRSAKTTFEGGQLHFQINEDLTEKLTGFAKSKGITLNTVLLSIYAVMINKLSGSQDFVIGCPTSVRSIDASLDTTIGLLANTVPHRVNLQNVSSFEEFAKNQAVLTADNYEHTHYPIEKVIEDLALETHGNRHPLFDTLFIYEAADNRLFSIPDLKFERFKYEKHTTMSDLVFEAIKEEGVINCSIEFDKNLFEKATIERFSVYFNNILSQILNSKDFILKDIDIMPTAEYELLKLGTMDYEHEISHKKLIEIYRNQIEKNYHKKAIITSDNSFTYRELDILSDTIAYYIQHSISLKDTKVAILLDRSENLVASMLACYKLGLPYIPLDKSTPKERNNYILVDSQADLLITENDQTISISQLLLDNIDLSREKKPNYAEDCNSLAYITYTSGSTGRPKGVIIRQENIVAFVENFDKVFGFASNEKILALTTVSFDISNLEIICSLLYGMTVVMASEAEINNLNLLQNLCRVNDIENIQLTPSRCYLLLQELGIDFLKSFKTILVGGEAMPISLYRELTAFENTKVINVYGPTETTIWSSSKQINNHNLNIGRALVGERIYILDKDNNLLPVGMKGEICIAGSGVGNGYFNRPELNSDRFIKTHFCDDIIYKTGDVGRINNQNEIEIFGRDDNQIKIRGYRVELEEIESIASSVEGVKSSVCTIDNTETTVLNLFYIGTVSDKELRNILIEKLPSYMIPTYINRVEQFPHTPNGKIDRIALKMVRKEVEIKDVPNILSTKEFKFVEILKKVLGVLGEVSLESDYFEIGGDSIKAIKLISALYRAGIETDFKTLFTSANLKEIIYKSKYLDTRVSIEADYSQNELIDLLPMQEGMIFESMGKDKSVYHEQLSFKLRGDLNLSKYQTAWQRVFSHFDIFRSEIDTDENYSFKRRIKESPKGKILVSENKDIESLKRIDLEKNFDIESIALYRLYINISSDNTTDVIFSYHHSILDGWSLTVIFDLVRNIYLNPEYNLSKIADSYTNISKMIGKQLTTYSVKEVVNTLLKPTTFQATPLCVVRVDRDNIKDSISTQSIEISATILDKLKWYAAKQKVSLQSLLLAVWSQQLCKLNHTKSAGFALSVSGRHYQYSNIEQAVGLLMNTLPISVGSENNISSMASSLQSKLASLLDYQHASLAEIITEMGRHDLFDHIIVIENYTPTNLSVSEEIQIENIDFYENTNTPAVVYFSVDKELTVVIKYQSIYESDRIIDFLDSFQKELEYIVYSPEVKSLPKKEEGSKIISLFEKILEVNNISLNSNFFENGGHSLKLIRLITSVYKEFNYRLEVEDIYINPTPYQLAKLIENRESDGSELVREIDHLPYQDKYDLSYAQKRLWLFAERYPEITSYNVFGNLIIQGDLNLPVFEATINAVLELHPIFRIKIENITGEPTQIVMSNQFKLRVHEFNTKAEEENYIQEFSQAKMSLADGNLFRVELIKIEDAKYIFLFNAHHIVFDGWSNHILLHQITTLYTAIKNGNKPQQESDIINYFDYAKWHNKAVSEGRFDTEMKYWQQELSKIETKSVLKGDLSAQINLPAKSNYKELKLHDLIISRRYSKFTILSAAVSLIISAVENSDKVIIGIPVSGRFPEIELSNVMGYFINTLPLIIDVDKEMTIEDYLDLITVKISLINSNQSYPLELLEEINGKEDFALNKLFNVIVNSFDSNLNKLELEGADVFDYPLKANQSKYDMQFYFEEKNEVKLLIEYSTDVYSYQFVEKLSQNLETTLNMMQVSGIKIKNILESLSETSIYNEDKFLSDIDNIDEDF